MDDTVSIIIKTWKTAIKLWDLLSECLKDCSKLSCTIATRRRTVGRKKEETEEEIKNRDRESYIQMGKNPLWKIGNWETEAGRTGYYVN
jgi:hypothetical protein